MQMKKERILLSFVSIGIAAGTVVLGKMERDRRKIAEEACGKFSALFHMMNHWLRVKQDGKKLASYFTENKYNKIAVYGMSYVGETLLEELKGTEVEVAYGIDKRAFSIHTDVAVVSPDDLLDGVDVVVVTAIDYFDEIKEKLKNKVECPIISIEDVVFAV